MSQVERAGSRAEEEARELEDAENENQLMIVCHCMRVTERAIRNAVREGARSRSEVARACAATLSCGGCAPAIDQIIEFEADRERNDFPMAGELVAN